MNLSEYASLDAVALAALVRTRQVAAYSLRIITLLPTDKSRTD